MIEVSIQGGLGNQLFQYASAYSISHCFNQEMIQDVSFFDTQSLRGYKLNQLRLKCSKITTSSEYKSKCTLVNTKATNYLLRRLNHRTIKRKNCTYWLDEIPHKIFSTNIVNAYMDGYFQSYLYFDKYRADLIEQICPIYEEESVCKATAAQIRSQNAIAVHVRRGDFKSAQRDISGFHYLLGEQYYHNALRYISEKLNSPVFFWFSDDIDWVKKNFGEKENFQFISLNTKHADIDEMMLMKKCKHIITANSTFSWWASWLNEYEDAIHICPAKKYGNVNMVPENWIKIAVE